MAHLPQIDLAAILATPNPTIDLRLASFETSTRNFLKAVSNYKNRAITTISERRTAQAAEKKRVFDKTSAIEQETNACKLREIDLVADLEREKGERKDAELSVAAFRRQLAALKEKCQSIEADIEEYRTVTANLRRERATERDTLRGHSDLTSSEFAVTERLLGCTVEGIGLGSLLIRFTQIEPPPAETECSLVLELVGTGYRAVTSSPLLVALPLLVNQLNATRDIWAFVKDVRKAYQAQLCPDTLD